jgi:hypothetical protein
MNYLATEQVRTIMAPHVTLQRHVGVMVLGFYDVVLPVMTGTDEQKKKIVEGIQETGLSAYCVARLAFTPDALRDVARLIFDTIGHGDEEEGAE